MKLSYRSFPQLILLLVLASFLISGCNEKDETAKKEEPKATEETKTAEQEQNVFSFATLPEIVAKVNGTDIAKKELEKLFTILSKQAAMSGQTKSDEEMLSFALNELINSEVLKQETVKKNIKPAADAVDKEFNAVRSRFPDEETFKKAIGEAGLSLEAVKSEIASQVALKELIAKEVESKVKISDNDIKKFYDENPNYFTTKDSVKASHILVKAEEGADEATVAAAKKKIEAILAEVKGGADFAETAKKSSEGPSGPNGGDLGFFARGQMVPPFEEAAFALKKGEISGIVKTQFGFHIIKVTDKKKAGTTPLKEVKDDIKAYLSKMEGGKMFDAYVEKLRASSTIVKNI